MGLFWTIGKNNEQLGPRSGRLLELGNIWEQQLQPQSGRLFGDKIMGLFWEQQLGPRSGRLLESGNNWEPQLQPRSGRLFENN